MNKDVFKSSKFTPSGCCKNYVSLVHVYWMLFFQSVNGVWSILIIHFLLRLVMLAGSVVISLIVVKSESSHLSSKRKRAHWFWGNID